MQEIKKRRILLASVLKPADEPRMYERMGLSLATRGYDVYIIGSSPSSAESNPEIQFIPHQNINRISAQRVLIRFKIIREIFSVRPDILIITTHELLGIAIIYKLLFQKKIVYDVQENYSSNIIHTNAFPKFLRRIISFFVRLKESIASAFLSHFILAEQCYKNELSFIGKKYSVIENKCKVPDYFKPQPEQHHIQLLFSGTLAESTGIFLAIHFAKSLHRLNPAVKLLIVGYCAHHKTLKKIKESIANCPFIELIGGDQFVLHQKIIDAISKAQFGLICYPIAPHIENKIPTKLYEYLSLQLPILIENHKPWKDLCDPFQAAIGINFNKFDAHEILNIMSKKSFYTALPEKTTWQSEEGKFLSVINSLLE